VYTTLQLGDTTIDISPQATNSVEALFITTYVVTLSTDLGGKAVTTSFCDVYLKRDAVLGIVPELEAPYLSECVDPSGYLCSSSTSSCGSGVPVTYPPKGYIGGAGTASATMTTSKTSGNGVGGLAGIVNPWLMLSMALAILCVA
jgi:hypothetical protein